MKRTAFTALMLIAGAAQAPARAACETPGPVVFCPTPAELANVWPLARSLFNTVPSQPPDPVHNLDCGFMSGKLPNAKIIEERQWNTKSGLVPMVHIDFGGVARFTKDTYAASGEYLGKKTMSYTSGWMLKREISCEKSAG